MIELTNIELFKSLATIESGSTFFDLHNNYKCTSIRYGSAEKLFELAFQATNSSVILKFEGAIISKMDLVPKRTEDSSTLNNFYRGRYVVNEEIFEHTPLGQSFYYIEFEEGDVFEVFAERVFILDQI
jgi:hypothetical protein